MSTVEENTRLMQTLDDAWNSQDWATFEKRHAAHVDVFWPGQAKPTHGRPSHKEEAIAPFPAQGAKQSLHDTPPPSPLVYPGVCCPLGTA